MHVTQARGNAGRPGAEHSGQPAAPGAAVPLLLRELAFELERFSQEFGRRNGLHTTDVHALGHLHQAAVHGVSMTPTELSTRIELSPPATSALLRRLETTGHVRRESDPDDGRRHRVVLEQSALDLGRAHYQPLADALRTSLADLDPDEAAVVERWLGTAIATTREAIEGLGAPGLSDGPGTARDDATADPTPPAGT